MIDLGAWASGAYRIPAGQAAEDDDSARGDEPPADSHS